MINYPSIYRRSVSSNWYFKYTDKLGNRYQKSTGTSKKGDANRYVRNFIDNLNESITDMTLGEYIQPFLDYETSPRVQRKLVEGKCIGKNHVKTLARLTEKHILPDPISRIPISDITPGMLLDFRSRLIRKNMAHKNTINKIMLALKSVFGEATLRKDIRYNPTAGIGTIKYEKIKKEILTIPEIQLLFSRRDIFPSDLAFQVFRLAAFTGMRMSEVLALSWDQIEDRKIIRIDRAWKTRTEIGLPKWNKTRSIPLSKSTSSNLPEQHSHKLVFCYEDGSRLHETWWRKNFNKIMDNFYKLEENKQAIRKVITPHCLRHTLNTHLIKSGISPYFIQEYLGWSQNSMLTRVQDMYTHIYAFDLTIVSDMIDELYIDEQFKQQQSVC